VEKENYTLRELKEVNCGVEHAARQVAASVMFRQWILVLFVRYEGLWSW